MTVVSAGGARVYTYPVRSRHGHTRRVQITLRDGEIASATWRALALSLGIGVPVLVLLIVGVGLRMRRTITGPLGRLRSVVELLSAGHAADPSSVGGATEVRAVARATQGIAGTVAKRTFIATEPHPNTMRTMVPRNSAMNSCCFVKFMERSA